MHIMSIEEFRINKYNSAKTDVVNQHYVCQGIQKMFSDSVISEKLVTCFSRKYKDKEDLKKVKELSTEKVMRLDNGYEIYNSYPNLLEQYFGYYENFFVPKVKELISCIENDYNYKSFKSFVFEYLEIFLLFYFRASYTMEYFTYKKDETMNKQVLDHKIIKQRIDTILGDVVQIKLLAESIKTIYGNPVLLVSNRSEFLLSDTYFSTWSNKVYSRLFSNREIGFYDTNILIPLSSKYYILFSNDSRWNKKNKKKVYSDAVKILNSVIFRNTNVYCIGKEKCLKETIKYLPNTLSPIMLVKGIKLNNGFSKGNICEDYKQDDLLYDMVGLGKFQKLRIVKDTYIEFFNNIVSCDLVSEIVKKDRNQELDYVFTVGNSKYISI